MKIWKLALAPVVLALLAVTASADEGDKPQRERRGPRDPDMRAKMIEKFDADGDGMLNDDERAKARAHMKEMHGGKDRVKGERGERGRRGGEARGEGRQRGPRPDGPPNDRARGPRGDGPRDRPGPPDPSELFDKFDKDDDGQLSREEFMMLAKMMRHRHGPPRDGERGGPPHGDFRRGGPDGPPPGGPGGRGRDRDRGPRRDRPEPEED